ncbi:MAG: hypothetical protein IJM75_01315 [Ruminococcus sp.]|nr:hypothetical protein [Ruminococcus sp.]
MKHTSFLRKKRIEIITLAAALAFTFAADSLIRPFNAYASTDEEADSEENEDVEAEIKSDILDAVHGSVEFWRWERVNKDNYPRDDQWHLSLFIYGDYDYPFKMGRLFSATAPGSIVIGKEASPISGVSRVIDEGDYGKYFVSTGTGAWGDYIREQYAHYVQLDKTYSEPANYRKYGVDTGKDVFFTTADMNPVSVKYTGANTNIDKPMYKIRLKSSTDTNYYLTATDKSSESLPQIVTSEDSAKSWTFRMSGWGSGGINGINSITDEEINQLLETLKKDKGTAFTFQLLYGMIPTTKEELLELFSRALSGYLFQPVIYDKGNDDEVLVTRNTGYVFTADDEDEGRYYDRPMWYIGEKYLFSALTGTTTVKEGQILSVTEADYIGGDGKGDKQNGVILRNGDKIIIEKGGILSIEGNFINNGTIENRGGTIIVKKGGAIFPFQQGTNVAKNGCGSIKCIGGDIIIQKGGAIYGGLSDTKGSPCPFWLDEGSVLMNQGLLVYGGLRLGNGSRVELYEDSVTYGSYGSQKEATGGEYLIKPSYSSNNEWMVSYVYDDGTTGTNQLLSQYMYGLRYSWGEELYNDYLTEFGSYTDSEKLAFADKVVEEAKKNGSNIVITHSENTYENSYGNIYSSKEEAIEYTEGIGYQFVEEDNEGTLHFTLYNFDANYNDLLSKNNTAFLNGTLTKLEFIQECKGLQGMYYQGSPEKMPYVSKVSSAKLTDISKSSGIKVTDLTL